MTTLDEAKKKCAVCGKISAHFEVTSTNTFGAPDLDTRPPEMMRSTMDMWVQECPSCGYLSGGSEKLREGEVERVSTLYMHLQKWL